MKAVVLVGGEGARMRPLTFSIPKPLLPLGERAILELLIEQLREAGFTDITLATGYRADLIRAFCGDGARFGVRIHYVHEDRPLGTAGPLALTRKALAGEDVFLLLNGDVHTGMDLRAFAEAARRNGSLLTVAYVNHVYRSPYGVLDIAEGAIRGVVEKPQYRHSISAGIYAMRPAAIKFIPDGAFFTVPDLIQALIAAGERVEAHELEGSWIGLDRVEDFEEALKIVGDLAAQRRRPKLETC
jgi:NDP-sugar pyrophosphorylase family protein